VDRAALDVAIALAIPYGGWCPLGGWAEDFPEPPGLLPRYPLLRETPLADPAQRTEWNLRDSDAVLVISLAAGPAVSRGTELATPPPSAPAHGRRSSGGFGRGPRCRQARRWSHPGPPITDRKSVV